MNGPSVGAPGWAVATHFYGNLQWIRKSVNARRAAAACRRICRVTPPVKEVLFVHYLLGSTWGELTLRSMTSPRCFMTGWACWAGQRRVWGEPLFAPVVGRKGKDPHFLPAWLSPSKIPLAKRSAGWSHSSHEDVDHFRWESQSFLWVSCRARVDLH